MTKPCASQVLGRWRITGMEGWDSDYVDLLGPRHVQFDTDGTLAGELRFHHGDDMPFTARRR